MKAPQQPSNPRHNTKNNQNHRPQRNIPVSVELPTGNAPQQPINPRHNTNNNQNQRPQRAMPISVELPTGNAPQQPINLKPPVHKPAQIRNRTQANGKYLIYYTNIDCMSSAKHKELEQVVETHHPDIITVSEVEAKNVRNKIQESEIQLKGYTIFHNLDIASRGVCIYVKENLHPNESDIKPNFTESIWVEIKETATEKTVIGCIYRSPNSSEENNKKVNDFIKGLGTMKNTNLILTGDYNYPQINWTDEGYGRAEEKKAAEFLDSVMDAYLTQHITEPTRYRTGQKENVLDLIFTLHEDVVEDIKYLPPIGKSDHCSIIFSVNKGENQTKNEKKTFYNYNKANYEGMKSDIKKVNWKDSIKEIEEGWKIIESTIHKAIEKHVPKSVINTNKRRRPLWMNPTCLSKVRKKHSAWKRYLETKSGEDYLKYTRARNQSRNATRKAQKEFESKLAKDVARNPKSFWKHVHSKTKTKNTIQTLICPEQTERPQVMKKKQKFSTNISKKYSLQKMKKISQAYPKKK